MFKVEQLPLWDVLKTVDDAQRAKVRKLLEDAAAILDRVIETFPTYTLHNATHAENVVKLMADLLGDRVKDLTPLEAALLMLSAFYHDIGMVFREEERNRLTEEPEWKTFLDTKPDAYLAVKKTGEVPLDIAEWYCRWRHADRVYVYLNRLPDDLLKWGQTSIREELGELCRSHNLPAADLYAFRTDFRSGEADLRFCAVLLRLADILDFDRTRSPEAVYEHLGLSRRIDPRQNASNVEWRKHLCSEGFQFPKKRPVGYQLGFVAGPDEPGVEHDLREFLTVIEEEMQQCQGVLANCSERWRILPLPASVNRSHIQSNGYRYGEYRFTLDQGQVMDLLMGENLYQEPYVFVRELIQNALDTSRHRRFIERASGNRSFEPKAIQVRHWIDRDGYQWVRFDDDGMGMNVEIVRNHLLKVGSSYYQTANFRAEILRARERTHEDFVPISRFGIGLLSCFIAADRVEISTLQRTGQEGKAEPIRLSLNGLHGFFTLQTPHLSALPMPAPDAEEAGYRTQPGTSIAVRLDPTRERGAFDPEALLKRHVACPPVPVEFEGERVGGDPANLLEHPWCEPIAHPLDPRYTKAIGEFFGEDLQDVIQVAFFPVDLTGHSPTKDLKGQIILAAFLPSPQLRALLEAQTRRRSLKMFLNYRDEHKVLHLELRFEQEAPGRGFSQVIPIAVPLRDNLRDALDLLYKDDLAWLSHNGVAVPTGQGFHLQGPSGTWAAGVVCLSDSLRPNYLVSRESLLPLPWKIRSTVELTLFRAMSAAGLNMRNHWRLFMDSPDARELLLGELLEDEYLHIEEGWASFPIIRTRDASSKSLPEIKRAIEDGPVELSLGPSFNFLDLCSATIIQRELNAFIRFESFSMYEGFVYEYPIISISAGEPLPLTEGHKLFPPLTFLPFTASKRLKSAYSPFLNVEHPFTGWLLEKAPEVARRYPGLFNRLRTDLLVKEMPQLAGLNSILDRLRELHPSVHPPKELILREEDFDPPSKP